ncbi:MAG TPA: hypothetical protein VGQ68_03115 [Gaiellaceae bacterium]|nr:hypothetical protein [Gaiellaceae bacterium]
MRRRDRHRRRLLRKAAGRLLATSLASVALFFAGASVSAWAGSEAGALPGSTDETGEVSTAETVTEQETVPSEPPGSEEDPSRRAHRLVRAYGSRLGAGGTARRASAPALRGMHHRLNAAASRQMKERSEPPRPQPPLTPPRSHASRAVDPEARAPGGAATICLRRPLPDPTPPAKRLSLDFAVQLALEARSARVSWSLVLAVLRVQGHTGPFPASSGELRALTKRLAALRAGSGRRDAVRALTGSASLTEKAVALAHYNRAVGLYSLVTGLERAKPRLDRLVLNDPRIDIYAGGRDDIASGLVDVRVIVLIRYLSDVFGQVTVSSLHSGHGLYARPGIVSAHVYGLAVDVSAVGETSIAGHQEPGGITERAVRSILLLPDELQPQQVISLLGLGGPSFPLLDHADHIHVGY